jgi:hypothetical protein
MNNATEYLNSIVSTLQDLDDIHCNWWKNDATTTIDRLREAASTDPEETARFDSLAQVLEDYVDEYAEDLGIAYLEGALDMWLDVKWRWNQSDVDKVVALMTVGGPRCEISFDGTETDVRVDVWWGSDHAYRTVECAPVAYAMLVTLESAEEALK